MRTRLSGETSERMLAVLRISEANVERVLKARKQEMWFNEVALPWSSGRSVPTWMSRRRSTGD